MKANNQIQYAPLKLLLSFLVFTEVLVFIGPIDYPINNPIFLILYLIIVNLSFYWGYKRGVSHFRPSRYRFKMSTVQLFIIFGFILNIMRLVELWSRRGLSISLSTIALAIINPGEVYYSESMEAVSSGLLSTILSPITWAVLPIGLYKWKDISLFYKVLVVLVILVQVITWLGMGTRKGLMDLIIIIAFFSFLNYSNKYGGSKISKRNVLWIIVSIITFISYFVISNLSRYGLTASEINQFDINHTIRPFYSNTPHWLLVSLININGYLCQGYYSLSIALTEGILFPTFLGMSWFTMVIASKFGYNPMPDTYLALLEQYGIDSHTNWHTIYVWLANDFTFIGVPFIIFIVGLMFARTWCECVKGDNEVAVPLFALFLIMVFYFFANNQVLSFSFMPFVTWWLFYRVTRTRA